MTAAPPQENKTSFLKIACFGCVGLIFLGLLGCAGITFGGISAVKSSQPYKDALAKAQGDARVVEALGTPVEDKWFAAGSVEDFGDAGTAKLMVPLKGSKAEGVMAVEAKKVGGVWKIKTAQIILGNGGDPIDLVGVREGKNESAAIGGLKTIVTAQALFLEADSDKDGKQNYGTLEELLKANLVDEVLGGGTKQGYQFQVEVSESKLQWWVIASPVAEEVGVRSFYTDQSGVIYSSEGKLPPGPYDAQKLPPGVLNGY